MSILKRAYLRRHGAVVGKNVYIGLGATIRMGKSARLSIGDNARIDKFSELIVLDGAIMEIGSDSYIGKRNIITAMKEIKIGNQVMAAHQVTIIDSQHTYDDPEIAIINKGLPPSPSRSAMMFGWGAM